MDKWEAECCDEHMAIDGIEEESCGGARQPSAARMEQSQCGSSDEAMARGGGREAGGISAAADGDSDAGGGGDESGMGDMEGGSSSAEWGDGGVEEGRGAMDEGQAECWDECMASDGIGEKGTAAGCEERHCNVEQQQHGCSDEAMAGCGE